MNSKELKASRIRLFRDAANFKKTDRIPHFANVVTWKIFDAGYTLDQAMTNFDVLEESVVKFLDKYPVDAVLDVGIRNQFNVTEAFGEGGYYYYNEEVVGIHDHAHCTVDTLMDYLDDPFAFREALPNVAIMGGLLHGCRACGKCAYPEPCRFPGKAMSSMEGYGLFVTQVCRDNGMKYYYWPKTIAYTGCVLF